MQTIVCGLVLSLLILDLGIYCLNSKSESRITETSTLGSKHGLNFSAASASDSFNASEHDHTLIKVLNACKWSHAVIFSNSSAVESLDLLKYVFNIFYSKWIPTAHYDLSSTSFDSVGHIILDLYNNGKATNFIWIGTQVEIFIANVSELLVQYSRSSLLLNRVQFLILSPSANVTEFETQYEEVGLDNIALFLLDNFCSCLKAGYTLMWRAHMRREFEDIEDWDSLKEGEIWKVFPNTKHLFNGRPVVAIVKEYEPFVYKGPDPNTGKLRFYGFHVDIANALAQSLNFTLILFPEPGEDDDITWTELSNMVAEAEVEFGLNFWTSNSIFNFNHTMSYPVLQSSLTGVYLDKRHPEYYSHFRLFRPEVFVCILCSMLFTIVLYLIIIKFVSEPDLLANVNVRDESNDTFEASLYTVENHAEIYQRGNRIAEVISRVHYIKNKNRTQVADQRKPKRQRTQRSRKIQQVTLDRFNEKRFKESNQNSCGTVARMFKKLCCQDLAKKNNSCPTLRSDADRQTCGSRYVEYVTDTFFRFLGSVFYQSILPKPKWLSARLLVWSWCVMLVILSAGYTGYMTAFLVHDGSLVPFTTFQQMIDSGEYTWGIDKDSSMIGVMEKSKNGSTLRQLFDGIQHFKTSDPNVIAGFDELISKVRSENFVALLFQIRFEIMIKQESYQNLKLIKENLLPTTDGLIFPRKSELRDLVSEHLLRMSDSGLIYALRKNLGQNATTDQSFSDTNKMRPLDITYIAGLCYVCGICVIVAFVIMLLECVIARLISQGHS